MTNLKLIINITIGSALIIYGSFMLCGALEKASESKIPRIVDMVRESPMRAFFASIAATALLQSSSAVTAITVSLAESGFLRLTSAMAVVYGANIGTTVTAQIMSFNKGLLGVYALLAGTVLKFLPLKSRRFAVIGGALIGIGMMFTGLKILALGAALMKDSPYIMNFISIYSGNAIYCMFFGFITTALLQSSSATVGLSIALFSGGVIGFKQAAALTLGDNIGTCVTALLASASGGAKGRSVAWGHMLYNIVCSVTVLLFLDAFVYAVTFITSFLGQSDAYLVANAHTLLNVLGALLFMPLNRHYCRFLERLTAESAHSGRRLI